MTETLRGQVASLRLFKDSWGVMELFTGSADERSQVVGTMLGFDIGDTIEAEGAWETHPRFGRRFKMRDARVIIPTDASGAIAWLAGRMPAIGRKLAATLVETYGLPGVWEVLEHAPERLVELDGITPERAAKIGEAYAQHRGERDRIVRFKQYGLTDRQIAKIQEALGHGALDEIRKDPYILIEKVDGFGWSRSDDLARRLGLPLDHPSRVRAGLEHLLGEARMGGHTYVPAAKLIAMGARLLGVPEEIVVGEGRAAINAGRMVLREGRGRDGVVQRVYAPELDAAEQSVADAVRRLVRGEGDKGSARCAAKEGDEAA